MTAPARRRVDVGGGDEPADPSAREATPSGGGGPGRTTPRATRKPSREQLLPEVRRLVTRLVGTVAHVDALLALRRAAPGACTLAEIAEAARVSPGPVARQCAEDLVAAGLAAPLADRCAYRYAPATAELREGVNALAAAYHARRTLVLRALYGHPAATFHAPRDPAAAAAEHGGGREGALQRRRSGPRAP